jgi:HAD superfamily hydrolase (TIGR01549 family)
MRNVVIKAVCFDLHNTLAHYEPSREEVYARACRESGIEVEPTALHQPLLDADAFWREENSRSPIGKRPKTEQLRVYMEYATRVFGGAGLKLDSKLMPQILTKVQQIGLEFKLYDDALPTLKLVKSRNLIVGVISNVGEDIGAICKRLGLEPYLDFYVSSFEVGSDKPRPGIFLAALEKAKVKPAEAIYVGDQYDLDIVGARGVGIKAVLLDRTNSFPNITDCPRIRSLTEVVDYL